MFFIKMAETFTGGGMGDQTFGCYFLCASIQEGKDKKAIQHGVWGYFCQVILVKTCFWFFFQNP